MTAAVSTLLRRAGEWFVEPGVVQDDILVSPPPRNHPAVAVVGLDRRCGATTIARALAAELAAREDGAAVVASPERPAVVALGSSAAAARLAEALPHAQHTRAAGRLCLVACAEPIQLAAATRPLAPAVLEIEPGAAAVEAAAVVDTTVLVASPRLEPALAAAVADTIAAVAAPPAVVINRVIDPTGEFPGAHVFVPEARMLARLALAGREPMGELGRAIGELADLCVGA